MSPKWNRILSLLLRRRRRRATVSFIKIQKRTKRAHGVESLFITLLRSRRKRKAEKQRNAHADSRWINIEGTHLQPPEFLAHLSSAGSEEQKEKKFNFRLVKNKYAVRMYNRQTLSVDYTSLKH